MIYNVVSYRYTVSGIQLSVCVYIYTHIYVHVYMYIPFFFRHFSYIGYYTILNRVPCPIQYVLIDCLF